MITSGFFPDINGDRLYTSDFLAKWVHSLISNGIYNGDFAITAGENMQVILPSGQAWINGHYCRNDGDIVLPIANADGVLRRKDAVVLRRDINTRNITAKVLTGTFASSPVSPAIVRNAEQYDLKLAEIDIAAGAISITQSAITDTRLDNTACGIVHAAIDHIDTTTLFNQLQAFIAEHKAQFTADMAAFKSQSGADFNTWFNGVKEILGKDEAGNLLNLINAHINNNNNPHNVTSKQVGALPIARTVVTSMAEIKSEGHYLIVGTPTSGTPTNTNMWLIDAKQEGWGMVAVAYGAWDAAAYISSRDTKDSGQSFYWHPWKMQYSTANMITSTAAPTSFLGVGVICNVIK